MERNIIQWNILRACQHYEFGSTEKQTSLIVCYSEDFFFIRFSSTKNQIKSNQHPFGMTIALVTMSSNAMLCAVWKVSEKKMINLQIEWHWNNSDVCGYASEAAANKCVVSAYMSIWIVDSIHSYYLVFSFLFPNLIFFHPHRTRYRFEITWM